MTNKTSSIDSGSSKPAASRNVKRKESRPLVSLLMAGGFIALLVTGLLSYLLRYSSLLAGIHTLFGLIFVGYGFFHLRNNWKSLKSYFAKPENKKWVWTSFSILPITVLGVALELPPFSTVIDVSYAFKELKAIDSNRFETVYTHFDKSGRELKVDFRAGDTYSGPGPKILWFRKTSTPQFAIWIEDEAGNYIDTLYATKKAATSSFFNANIFSDEIIRRPESLPHWSFARGVEDETGLMMPSRDNPLADAMTGATPPSHFDLETVIDKPLNKFFVKMEINRSYDFNDHYHPQAFPDDPVYSGSGNSAQPSLIYGAEIDLAQGQNYFVMKLLGRGHHSGQDGKLYSDLAGITTAKDMVGRAIIEVL